MDKAKDKKADKQERQPARNDWMPEPKSSNPKNRWGENRENPKLWRKS